jgi:hypothetical protein
MRYYVNEAEHEVSSPFNADSPRDAALQWARDWLCDIGETANVIVRKARQDEKHLFYVTGRGEVTNLAESIKDLKQEMKDELKGVLLRSGLTRADLEQQLAQVIKGLISKWEENDILAKPFRITMNPDGHCEVTWFSL